MATSGNFPAQSSNRSGRCQRASFRCIQRRFNGPRPDRHPGSITIPGVDRSSPRGYRSRVRCNITTASFKPPNSMACPLPVRWMICCVISPALLYTVAADAGSHRMALLEACKAAVRTGFVIQAVMFRRCLSFLRCSRAGGERNRRKCQCCGCRHHGNRLHASSLTYRLPSVANHACRIREHNLIKINRFCGIGRTILRRLITH
jgi:hypothetical protein